MATRGTGAFPNNTAFVHEFTTNLLTTSFPNMRPQQVQVCGALQSAQLVLRCSCSKGSTYPQSLPIESTLCSMALP